MAIEGDSWQRQVRGWLESHRAVPRSVAADVIRFFELSFEHVQCGDRAWFGEHQDCVSLVVGGIWLAALDVSEDKPFWLLVGQDFPPMEVIESCPAKSTLRSRSPLRWACFSWEALPKVIACDKVWNSYAEASEKILDSKVSADRDAVQIRRRKRRLTEVLAESLFYPDEVPSGEVFPEGAVRQVSVNAFERNPIARRKCIEHFGASCAVCGFDFGRIYGKAAEGYAHVHHLRPLSQIRAGYRVNPLEDLRPVCPNCHAVIHRRDPAFSLEDVREMLARSKGTLGAVPDKAGLAGGEMSQSGKNGGNNGDS